MYLQKYGNQYLYTEDIPLLISPDGISSTATLGTISVDVAILIKPSGIASTAVLGTIAVDVAQLIKPSGIASTATLGTIVSITASKKERRSIFDATTRQYGGRRGQGTRVNVKTDWQASFGDAEIKNKPFSSVVNGTVDTNTTFSNPTGTFYEGHELTYRFKDDGTSRTITWGTQFRDGGATPPTSTTINKWHTVKYLWNSTDEYWDCISAIVQP